MKRWIKIAAILVVLILVIPMVVSAQGGVIEGDRAIFGQSFVLESGQTMRGDLSVLGGVVRIEAGARLDGQLAVVGGTVTVDGEITGDVAVFGGAVRLNETAVVSGDLASIGGNVTRAPGARIEGESVEGFEFNFEPPVPIMPGAGFSGGGLAQAGDGFTGLVLRVLGFILRFVVTTLALAALAFVVALFIPQNTRRVGRTVTKEPLMSFGLGCLTMPAAVVVTFLLAIILIGIPVIPLLWVALVAAWAFGLIGLGYMLGDRMLRAADIRSPRVTAAAVAGTIVLSIAWTFVDVIWCLDGVVFIIVSSLAIGAALLSRFGTAQFPSSPEPAVAGDEPLIGPIDPFEPAESPTSPPPPSQSMEQMMSDIAAAQEEEGATDEGANDENSEPAADESDTVSEAGDETVAEADDVDTSVDADAADEKPADESESDADDDDEGPRVPPEQWS